MKLFKNRKEKIGSAGGRASAQYKDRSKASKAGLQSARSKVPDVSCKPIVCTGCQMVLVTPPKYKTIPCGYCGTENENPEKDPINGSKTKFVATVSIAVELEKIEEDSTSIHDGATSLLAAGRYTVEIQEVK